MRRHIALIGILCFILVGCGGGQGEGEEWYFVERVVDGDTVILMNGERVRYLGIDTPETKHPSKPVEYFGPEASEFNRKLVEGRVVRLQYDVETRDKYGRLLAYLYLEDGIFVNAELLREGYARVLVFAPNVKYEKFFGELARQAREDKKGMWGR